MIMKKVLISAQPLCYIKIKPHTGQKTVKVYNESLTEISDTTKLEKNSEESCE